LKLPPPKGHKLLIISTTKYRHVLDQFDLLESFSTSVNLPNMTSGQHILHVLNQIEHDFNEDEMKLLQEKLNDKK